MTSDDRREVAQNLRNGGIARNSEEAYVLLLSRVGIRPQLPAASTYKDAMTRLADLIDPTTTVDETGVETVVDAVHLCECNECGHSFEWVYGEYEYCPRCGARVVMPNGD